MHDCSVTICNTRCNNHFSIPCNITSFYIHDNIHVLMPSKLPKRITYSFVNFSKVMLFVYFQKLHLLISERGRKYFWLTSYPPLILVAWLMPTVSLTFFPSMMTLLLIIKYKIPSVFVVKCRLKYVL